MDSTSGTQYIDLQMPHFNAPRTQDFRTFHEDLKLSWGSSQNILFLYLT